MELEVVKICSFYINKAEPLLDTDLRNCYPAVDRLRILDEVLACENEYQEAKLELVQTLLEAYEHVTDILEQQRLVQAIVDEMAKRPRLNLMGTHFKDSYRAEVECMQTKSQLVRDVIRMIMKDEFKINTATRTYIEKSYRYLYDLIKGKFKVVDPEEKETEINAREVIQTGDGGTRHAANDQMMDTEFETGRKVPVTDSELRERGDRARETAAKLHTSYHF
jgi:hypothetical protein